MYQIFPDRFYKSGAAKGEIPTGRTFHENWQDQPDWAPNAQGKITNTDFFGGDLQGIREKLPYLKELGVTCLYMNLFSSPTPTTGTTRRTTPKSTPCWAARRT